MEAVEGVGDEDGQGRPRTKWTTSERPCTRQLLREVSSERVSESGQQRADESGQLRADESGQLRADESGQM